MEIRKGDEIRYISLSGMEKGICKSVHKLCIVVEHGMKRVNVAYAFIETINGKKYWQGE